MVMVISLVDLGYIYSRCRLKKPPNIITTLTHFGQITIYSASRIEWTLDLRGREKPLNRLSHATALIKMENQEGPTAFYISIKYTLWDSGCTKSIDPYSRFYIE